MHVAAFGASECFPLAARISRSANNARVQDCKIKPNAVKAVTALHLKMTAHAQPASRFQKPKQANQTARQARQAHAPSRRTYYADHHKTNIQTQQTSSDKIVTWRCDHQYVCMYLHNAYMLVTTCLFFRPYRCTDAAATYLQPHRCRHVRCR